MKLFKDYSFRWWEITLVKICLISLGILLGLYFYDVLIGMMWFWWVLFIATGIYFVVKCFKKG